MSSEAGSKVKMLQERLDVTLDGVERVWKNFVKEAMFYILLIQGNRQTGTFAFCDNVVNAFW